MRWYSRIKTFFRRKKKPLKPYVDYWTLHPKEWEKFKAEYQQKHSIEYGDMIDEIKPIP